MKRKTTVILLITIVLLLTSVGIATAYFSPRARAHRLMNLGNKYLNAGNYTEAILAFQKAIEIQPRNINTLLALGKTYIKAEKTTLAEGTFQQILSISPKNAEALEGLIDIYLKSFNISKAEKILNVLDDTGSEIYVKLMEKLKLQKTIAASREAYNLGMSLFRDKKYLEAIEALKKVSEKDNENYKDALTKISECTSNYIITNIELAKAEAQIKKYDSAISYLNLVLAIAPSNTEAMNLRNEYTKAKTSLQKSIPVSQERATEIAFEYESKYRSPGAHLMVIDDDVVLEKINGISYYIIPVRINNLEAASISSYYAVQQSNGNLFDAFDYIIMNGSLKPLK